MSFWMQRRLNSVVLFVLITVATTWGAYAAFDLGSGRVVGYTGHLQENGADVDGARALRFALTSTDNAGAALDCLASPALAADCGIWNDTFASIEVNAGMFHAQLGKGSGPNLTDEVLQQTALYVSVAVADENGDNWVVVGTPTRLLGVPYAHRVSEMKNYTIEQLTADTVRTDVLAIRDDQSFLEIQDEDGEAIVRISENNTAGRVELLDSADLIVPGLIDANGGADIAGLDVTAGAVVAGGLDVTSGGLTVTNTANTSGATSGRLVTNAIALSADTGTLVIEDDDGEDILTIVETSATPDIYHGDNVITHDLRVVNEGSVNSGGDSGPESYQLTAGPTCSSSRRGNLFVARPSGAGAQDALCVCIQVDGDYENWCFNP